LIKGFLGTSLVDYPGKVASVIFTGGCNLRCPFCYNVDLVDPERLSKLPDISLKKVLEELRKRKGFIDGVVITGGEPLMHRESIVELAKTIKEETGLSVKIDTNGQYPEVLKELLPLVDFIALDVKGPSGVYKELGGEWEPVEECIRILKSSQKDYEIRITAFPPFINEKTIKELKNTLKGAKRIVLQKFVNSKETLDPSCQNIHPYTRKEMEQLASILECVSRYITVR